MRETISIQYLRAIAALMVVVYHAMTRIPPLTRPEPFSLGGWAGGVDIFFVISGFIMWSTTARRHVSTGTFLWARLVRIVPLYWIALTVFWVILAGENGIGGAPGAWDVIRAAAFVPYHDAGLGLIAPYLTPGWTLTYEMVFYAVFAVALALEHKPARLAFVGMVFVAMMALRFRWGTSDPILFRLTSPLFFEFLAGMVAAEIFTRLRGSVLLPRLGVGALAACALFVVALSGPHFHDWARIVDFGVPATLLVFGAVAFEDAIASHPLGWLKHLGDASYSLYLAHDIYLHLAQPHLVASGLGSWAQGAIYVGGSLAVGLVVHALVERPTTRAIKAWRNASQIGRASAPAMAIGAESIAMPVAQAHPTPHVDGTAGGMGPAPALLVPGFSRDPRGKW